MFFQGNLKECWNYHQKIGLNLHKIGVAMEAVILHLLQELLNLVKMTVL